MNKKELFSLGKLYVSDFIKDGNEPRGPKTPLTLIMEEETKSVRLSELPNRDTLYGQYWYRSGINATMTRELGNIVNSCTECIEINDDDVWLDIACNDGTLLKQVPRNMIKIGIDPADDTYANESMQVADLIIQNYFNKESYFKSKFGHKKAKIITAIAMFYDLEDPVSFLKDVYSIMKDNGLFILQMSYTPLMLKQLAFDNICHEHVYYYNLTNIKYILEKVGFSIVDCQLNDINGGSFRIYIRKNTASISDFKSSPYRDVANYRINSILEMEKADRMDTPDPYMEFWQNINLLKDKTMTFIKKAKSEGKTIWGYGASTKGNTLLQWFNLDETLIDGIAERNPYKYGHKTVGTNIPIFPEDEMRKKQPDYCLILPWHFVDEFVEREKDYLRKGGKFIVPCPQFQVLGC